MITSRIRLAAGVSGAAYIEAVAAEREAWEARWEAEAALRRAEARFVAAQEATASLGHTYSVVTS